MRREVPTNSETSRAPLPGARRRLGRRVPAAVLLGALAGASLGWVVHELLTWPDVTSVREGTPRTTAFIEAYRQQRRAAGEDDSVACYWVPYERISPHLKRAVLVAEDIDFFSHDGFDRQEIRVALREAWEERRRPRGASTITQQLGRNLWLSPARHPWRKVKEALLTRQLERRLSKRRILELYLNLAEFGPGLYGAEAAARHYFGKAASQLDEHEAARLAAVLPRPRSWHPGSASRAYEARVRSIERRMERAEFLWGQI